MSDTDRPKFFWQGTLIVLPALLLAGVGIYSLRQDRAIARVEAAEQAQTVAAELADSQLPGVFSLPDLDPRRIDQFYQGTPTAQTDPREFAPYLFDDRLVYLFSADGSPEYPPDVVTLPTLKPLEVDRLSAGQRRQWDLIEHAGFRRETPGQVDTCREFLGSQPPRRFAAAATYRLAKLQERFGRVEDAREQLQVLLREYPDVETESGFPLDVFGLLDYLRLSVVGDAPIIPSADYLAELQHQIVSRPSILTGQLLEKALSLENQRNFVVQTEMALQDGPARDVAGRPAGVTRLSDGWGDVYRQQEWLRGALRAFFAPINFADTRHAQGVWLRLGKEREFLVMRAPAGEGRQWLVARPIEEIEALVANALQHAALPRQFAVSVELAGRTVADLGGGQVQASASHEAAGLSPGLRVQVYLRNPDEYFARERKRSTLFGMLILISVIAVFGGFYTAWKSFNEQRELSDLKTGFVSSVSHELRTPIASVQLMAEELREFEKEDFDKMHEYHEFIYIECRRLAALVENVLDFSRIEQGRKDYDFEPVDIEELAHRTAMLMQTYGHERRVKVRFETKGTPVPVDADGPALQQVLVNLTDNAIKHSPEGAEVVVTLAYLEKGIELKVKDSGPGIPFEDQRRIFKRFYRRGSELHRESQGVGLGLAIVQHVVDAHHGVIEVESEVGQGATFIVRLPSDPLHAS